MFPFVSSLLVAADTEVDLEAAGETVALAVGIYLVLLTTGKLLKRQVGVSLGRVFQCFSAAAGAYGAATYLVPWMPGRTELGALTALLGTGVFVRLVDQYFWRLYFEGRRKIPVPKFIREVTAGLLFVAVVLLVIQYGYGKPIPGLLAASGVVGIVLGFAMQDSLGNIIAGFALQFGRPFQIGDWLLVDGQSVQAVEINWRSTRFITNDEVQLDVPNQHLVRQSITNYHGGGSVHGMRLEIGLESDLAPNHAKDVLLLAAASAEGVLAEPVPNVFLKNFGDSAVIYEVRFWIDNHRRYNAIADAVRTNIWYALHRHRINVPYPTRTLHLDRTHTAARSESQREHRASVLDLMRGQPLFETMGNEHVQMVIDRCHAQRFGRGEAIIREGADGASMFVLVSGEASVIVGRAEHGTRVATLNAGDCFGEMSLLTGEKRSASVVAISDCKVLEITKPLFAEIIAEDDGLLPRLSELLASRQMQNEGIAAARAQGGSDLQSKAKEYQAGFLQRLKSFFDL